MYVCVYVCVCVHTCLPPSSKNTGLVVCMCYTCIDVVYQDFSVTMANLRASVLGSLSTSAVRRWCQILFRFKPTHTVKVVTEIIKHASLLSTISFLVVHASSQCLWKDQPTAESAKNFRFLDSLIVLLLHHDRNQNLQSISPMSSEQKAARGR